MRAGDADHFQLPRRVADECLAQLAVGNPAVVDDALWYVENWQLPFTDYCGRAAADGFGRIIMTVTFVAIDRDVYVARLNLLPIAGAACYAQIAGAVAA